MKLLFEIGMEELPARFLLPVLQDLKNIMEKKLTDSRIKFGTIKTFGTPRRLILLVEELSEKEEDLDSLNIGPAKNIAFTDTGEVSRAGLGFLSSQGMDSTSFEVVETSKGEYIAVKKFEKGRLTKEVIPAILKDIVLSLTFPKSMKWGNKKIKFARPIQWFLALLNDEIVEFEIEGIKSDRKSHGHRFFGEEFIANSIPEYFEKIRKNNVIIDILERKNLIKSLIEEKCNSQGEYGHIEEELLDEVTNLVEYPYPIVGGFNEEFLEVPQEVLIITMQVHQRYFPILNKEGQLQPKFIVVRNGVDYSEEVKRGNEKVISARLADARFFYNEDIKIPLYENLEKLKTVVYQKKLGTIYEKVQRMKKIASSIMDAIEVEKSNSLIMNFTNKREDIMRTIELSKADLVSNMIGEKEFTKLQGFMGEEYAIKSGEKREVALGIKEHYYPRYTGDSCPTGIEGTITALADRIDTLVGCFSVGVIPTGSKDPFALRRASIGVVNIILNSGINFSIAEVIMKTLDILSETITLNKNKNEIYTEVIEFFRQRIINILAESGYRKDIIGAVLSVESSSIIDVKNRVEALQNISENADFEKLLSVLKRVGNISKNKNELVVLNEKLLILEVEKELWLFTEKFGKDFEGVLEKKNYNEYLNKIILGIELIDRYFTEVMVMDENIEVRENRLFQMSALNKLFNKIAIIEEIEN
jgi:glycyl-tRNA synthetase beta chain